MTPGTPGTPAQVGRARGGERASWNQRRFHLTGWEAEARVHSICVDTKVDYYKFSLKLVGPQRRLIRAHVYTGAYDQVREPERHASL